MKVSILPAPPFLSSILLEEVKLLVHRIDQGHDLFVDCGVEVRAAAAAAADEHAADLFAAAGCMEYVRAGKDLGDGQGPRGQRGAFQETATIDTFFHG